MIYPDYNPVSVAENEDEGSSIADEADQSIIHTGRTINRALKTWALLSSFVVNLLFWQLFF
jgi:hypothetical protein